MKYSGKGVELGMARTVFMELWMILGDLKLSESKIFYNYKLPIGPSAYMVTI